jgi:hypothetical protein
LFIVANTMNCSRKNIASLRLVIALNRHARDDALKALCICAVSGTTSIIDRPKELTSPD